MVSPSLIDRIKATPWHSHAQPEWNTPTSVAEALLNVVNADAGAFDSLLYAIGNNHAGTFYPVLLAVLPFLEEVVQANEVSAQRIALGVLDDLYASFHPEPGYEEVNMSSLGRRAVEAEFRNKVQAMVPALERIVEGRGANASLAEDLLCLVSEDAA